MRGTKAKGNSRQPHHFACPQIKSPLRNEMARIRINGPAIKEKRVHNNIIIINITPVSIAQPMGLLIRKANWPGRTPCMW